MVAPNPIDAHTFRVEMLDKVKWKQWPRINVVKSIAETVQHWIGLHNNKKREQSISKLNGGRNVIVSTHHAKLRTYTMRGGECFGQIVISENNVD